ncbi:MAG: RNA 2',3'-cyclic phosphodiesterase, partial [Verrucomicrobiae bacterium]|nr:RNA 2',3'-cyclic phosphodiesterase [Verrucomicrobiae bacterium]
PAVLWAGLGTAHPHLFQLHKQVDDALFAIGIEPDRRIYRPHITLSRCKGTSRESLHPFLRENAAFETAPFRVERFHLVSSEWGANGPRYDCLETYELEA